LHCFPEIDKRYSSESLFPIFFNRILPATRQDYADYISWLNIPSGQDEPFALLAKSGGEKATDNLQIFPCPEPSSQNRYEIQFFAHGIRHIEGASERVGKLMPGDLLSLAPEPDNPADALALRVLADNSCLGYCPRYLNEDLHKLRKLVGDEIIVTAAKINPSAAPIQYRLLCQIDSPWPTGFRPFASETFEDLSESVTPITKEAPAGQPSS